MNVVSLDISACILYYSPKKNFLPNLSICRMHQMFPGRAASEMMNELMNTSLLGMGFSHGSVGGLSFSNSVI